MREEEEREERAEAKGGDATEDVREEDFFFFKCMIHNQELRPALCYLNNLDPVIAFIAK